METREPNVILITTDQQRYDTVGAYGSVVRTPVADQMAEEGCLFEYAFCNNPVCMPSRACMQTGRYTHQHGLRYMDSAIHTTPGLPPWEVTFMERLQNADYRTGAFGKIHMAPHKGFDVMHVTNGQGARWTTPYGAGAPFGPHQLGDDYAAWLEKKRPGAYGEIYEQRQSEEYRRNKSAVTSVLAFDEYVDYWATENTINFIEQEKDRPFFAWYSLCNPHGPVDAPAPYSTMYDPDEIVLSDKYTKRPEGSRAPEPDVMRRWIAHYYGLCTMIDDLVGMVIAKLKELDLYDNTLILFTSDHGEMMGDFGKFGKGNFLEQVIRMPLIVKPPAGEEGIQSKVSDLVELIDLAPTILDYAGVRIPSTIQGSSLRPVMTGEANGKEQILCEQTTNKQDSHGKCIRTERYKYARWSPQGREELYDLHEDPDEWVNLAGDERYASILSEMRARLIDHLSTTERPIVVPNRLI